MNTINVILSLETNKKSCQEVSEVTKWSIRSRKVTVSRRVGRQFVAGSKGVISKTVVLKTLTTSPVFISYPYVTV